MSRIAEYLQEHIAGELSVHPSVLACMSRDRSVLEVKPEMVVYPRVTNDIRKVTRFSWQLAEKGHILPVTVRGDGTDESGAAIGSGAIISTTAHMDAMLEFDPKQKLIRLQPGLSAKALNDALILHGLAVPALPSRPPFGTLGGAVANNVSSVVSGQYGDMRAWTYQLEVVLANGDVLQTERINRRELNRRKGLQTFEGEIYRTIDGIIEDNKQLIEEKIGTDAYDSSGYSAIAKVKHKDGSFDLTPLIVGSQGTLGIISEMIVKAEFVSLHTSVVVAGFNSTEEARDVLDELKRHEPAFLEYFDGKLFEIAAGRGKRYSPFKEADSIPAAVIIIGFNDFNERARRKKLKKAEKFLAQAAAIAASGEGVEAAELLAIREVTSFVISPNQAGASAPPLVDGAYVPAERFEDFSKALSGLADKHHVTLPLHVNALTDIIYTRPTLYLHKVGDRQKVFKLLDEYTALVASFGGCLVAEGGEGRLKARFAHAQLDEEVKEVYAAVKSAFDPYGILNPGVKQSSEVRQMVTQLRKDYDLGFLSQYTLSR